jgi:hypothetical protein
MFFLFCRKPFLIGSNTTKKFNMKKAFFSILALSYSILTFSQKSVNEKVVIVNGGRFESVSPFADYVTVGIYNPLTKNYNLIDTLLSQSAQGALVDGQNGFVLAEKVIAKYDFKSEIRLQSGTFGGVVPRSLAVGGSTLLVGNWYGRTDSCLYAYNSTTLAPLYAVAQIEKEVQSIAIVGDTAYLAQNNKGTIDQCGGFGCFNDSIGFIAMVRVSSGAFLGNVILGDSASGLTSFYSYQNKIVGVSTVSNNIVVYDISSQSATFYPNVGSVGSAIALVGNELHFLLNGKAAIFDLISKTVTSNNLSAVEYPVSVVYEPLSNQYYQSISDYSTFGKVLVSKNATNIDSFAVGISPEAMALYYSIDSGVLALDDYVLLRPSVIDTLLKVVSNDTAYSFGLLSISWVSTPLLLGASVSIDTLGQLKYTLAPGIASTDTIRYSVCNLAGSCDTATLVIAINDGTGINKISPASSHLFPNPFSNQLNIDDPSLFISFAIFNVVGKRVFESQEVESIYDLSTLPKGMYMAVLKSKEQTFSVKVIKQ